MSELPAKTCDDGGPAFPQTFGSDLNGIVRCSDDLGYGPRSGMSLRDYFAGEALKALVGGEPVPSKHHAARGAIAYDIADGMIAARKK